MHRTKMRTFIVLWIVTILQHFSFANILQGPENATALLTQRGLPGVWAADAPNQTDVQWFKDQMRISPKYLESHEGILGMSWLHFLTMVFLTVFFIGALIALYLRNRRTKQILAALLREEKNESKD